MREHTKSSPNWSSRPDGLSSVRAVILHHTATHGDSGQAVANFFAHRSAQVSAHWVIDEDGEVWHCVPIARAAWHAGECRRVDWDRDGKLEDWERYVNSLSIGIEFCNTGRTSDNYPDAQIHSAATLIRRADAKCPNLNLRNITDHAAVNLNGKVDVSATFPAARLFWYILHPRKAPPANIYAALPGWAQHQVDQIKK
jgi:N-acetylmuramoyl-L-alanine amidase